MQQLKSSQNDDRNRGPILLAVAVTLGPVAVITTCLRIWFRTSKRQLGLDDLFISVSALLLVVLTTVDILDVHAGLGRHRYSLDVHQVKKILKWALIMYILEYITICLVKISISLMILRYKKERWLKYSLYGLMAGLVVTNGACIIGLFVCPDPKKFNYLAYVQSAYSILSDFVCSFLPIVVIWNIQIPVRLKVALCGLMALGLLATACCIARISLTHRNESHDLFWTQIPIDIWGTCELTLAITAANLALSRGIFQFLRDKYHGAWNIIFPRGPLAANKPGMNTSESAISKQAPANVSSNICLASSSVERETTPKSMV